MGCTIFRTHVNDVSKVLHARAIEDVWDLELYELPAGHSSDSTPGFEDFTDSGKQYIPKERQIYLLKHHHLDSVRIHRQRIVPNWFETERPALSDSLDQLYPGTIRRFIGEFHLTNDTVVQWLSTEATLGTSDQTKTVVEILKPDHWYMYAYDTEGSRSRGWKSMIERRVTFRLDSTGTIRNWQSTRQKIRKTRIV